MSRIQAWWQLVRDVAQDVWRQLREASTPGNPMTISGSQERADPTTSTEKPRERVLHEAVIADSAPLYASLAASIAPAIVGLICLVTIVLIPITLIAAGGIAIIFWYYRRYYAALRVTLTTRDLKVHRGILNREEKTIPLEKITDLAIFQGPIMRHFQLEGIRVETAGQTGAGALVSVVGIENTHAFRDMVLNQRDRVTDTDDHPPAPPPTAEQPAANDPAVVQALDEIHETLKRIEQELARRP